MATRSLLLILSVFILTTVLPKSATANENDYMVFDVRKTLPLTDSEAIYKDFYVNIGTESGVKVGSILAVYRRMPVIDFYRNKAQGDLVVPVGHLRVIHSQKTMSVCRIASIASEKQIPVVPYETVMMGDRVEIAGGDEGSSKNLKTGKADEATAQNDADAITGEEPRQPAATPPNADSEKATPVKKSLSAKKMKPKQAKPSVKALPLPAQA